MRSGGVPCQHAQALRSGADAGLTSACSPGCQASATGGARCDVWCDGRAGAGEECGAAGRPRRRKSACPPGARFVPLRLRPGSACPLGRMRAGPPGPWFRRWSASSLALQGPTPPPARDAQALPGARSSAVRIPDSGQASWPTSGHTVPLLLRINADLFAPTVSMRHRFTIRNGDANVGTSQPQPIRRLKSRERPSGPRPEGRSRNTSVVRSGAAGAGRHSVEMEQTEQVEVIVDAGADQVATIPHADAGIVD